MFAVSAAIFANLVNLEHSVTQSTHIRDFIALFISDLVDKLKVAKEQDEIYYDLIAHTSNSIKFLAVAVHKYAIASETFDNCLKTLFASASSNSDYVQILINALETVPTQVRSAYNN